MKDSIFDALAMLFIAAMCIQLAGGLVATIAERRAIRRRDRIRRGACPECAYDMRANDGVCPECGTRTAELAK